MRDTLSPLLIAVLRYLTAAALREGAWGNALFSAGLAAVVTAYFVRLVRRGVYINSECIEIRRRWPPTRVVRWAAIVDIELRRGRFGVWRAELITRTYGRVRIPYLDFFKDPLDPREGLETAMFDIAVTWRAARASTGG
ncbi:MAG: hypothetical protein ABR520_03085 [Mycobacteriales bacterium]|nr:hypothetical protein [Frankia sp.]